MNPIKELKTEIAVKRDEIKRLEKKLAAEESKDREELYKKYEYH